MTSPIFYTTNGVFQLRIRLNGNHVFSPTGGEDRLTSTELSDMFGTRQKVISQIAKIRKQFGKTNTKSEMTELFKMPLDALKQSYDNFIQSYQQNYLRNTPAEGPASRRAGLTGTFDDNVFMVVSSYRKRGEKVRILPVYDNASDFFGIPIYNHVPPSPYHENENGDIVNKAIDAETHRRMGRAWAMSKTDLWWATDIMRSNQYYDANGWTNETRHLAGMPQYTYEILQRLDKEDNTSEGGYLAFIFVRLEKPAPNARRLINAEQYYSGKITPFIEQKPIFDFAYRYNCAYTLLMRVYPKLTAERVYNALRLTDIPYTESEFTSHMARPHTDAAKNYFATDEQHIAALCAELKVHVSFYDIRGEQTSTYEDYTRTKKLAPSHLHLVYYNGHVFMVRNPRAFYQSRKTLTKIGISDKYSTAKQNMQYDASEEVFVIMPSVAGATADAAAEANTYERVCKTINDIITCSQSPSSLGKDGKYLIVIIDDFAPLISMLWKRFRITPQIMLDTTGGVRQLIIHTDNQTIRVISEHHIKFSAEQPKAIDEYKSFMSGYANARSTVIINKYISTYSRDAYRNFSDFAHRPLVHRPCDTKPIVSYDIKRCYTSILYNINKVPIISSADEFIPLDDTFSADAISDTEFYIIMIDEYAMSRLPETARIYMHSQYMMIWGANFSRIMSLFPIITDFIRRKLIVFCAHLRPHTMRAAPYSDLVQKIYANDNLADSAKKSIINTIIGCMGKKYNKIGDSYLFHTYEEALEMCATLNKATCLSDVSPNMYHVYPTAVNISERMYIIRTTETQELRNGYLPIHHILMDTSLMMLCDFAISVQKHFSPTEYTFGYNTDAIFIYNRPDVRQPRHESATDEYINKVRNMLNNELQRYSRDEQASKEAEEYIPIGWDIGTIRIEKPHSQTKSMITPELEVKRCRGVGGATNEWDTQFLNKQPTVIDVRGAELTAADIPNNALLLGRYPGVGKSYNSIVPHLREGKKIHIAAPYNNLCQSIETFVSELCAQFPNAPKPTITTYSALMGGLSEFAQPITIASDVEVFIVDEVFLLSIDARHHLEQLRRKHPKIKFVANGDVSQLKCIEESDVYNNMTHEQVIAHKMKHISATFNTHIVLSEIKRVSADEAKIMCALIDEMRTNLNDAPLAILRKYLPASHFVDNPTFNDIRLAITGYNTTRRAVNRIIGKIDTGTNITPKVGQEYICRKTNHDHGVYCNMTYTITKIDKAIHIGIGSGKSTQYKLSEFSSSFDLPYARTNHSVQGCSIDVPYIIYNIPEHRPAATEFIDLNWILVAITRTKSVNNIYINVSSNDKYNNDEQPIDN